MSASETGPGAYSQTTRAICVTVQPVYLANQSEPDEGRYFWAYHVRIENQGNAVAQLLTRHWRIVDARGQAHDVIGDGVVGEKPVLNPGEAFEYTSGTPLGTASGFMSGSFLMIGETGEMFDVAVPAFSLDSHDGPRPVH
ncbi:MAG: Co2+/Mg2+ efflux protein ApaG [Rhodospirillaceae bacterium]